MSEMPVVQQCAIFATPSLDHRVTLDYLRSWTETIWLMSSKGIAAGRVDRGGDCFVAKARSKLVTDFLNQYPMATDLFFLDDDIGWPAEKVIEFVFLFKFFKDLKHRETLAAVVNDDSISYEVMMGVFTRNIVDF